MQRLRPLTEEECYLRCYGWVGRDEDAVRVLDSRDEVDAEGAAVLAERMRRAYERRLEGREAEAA
jgi:hypothetical protein